MVTHLQQQALAIIGLPLSVSCQHKVCKHVNFTHTQRVCMAHMHTYIHTCNTKQAPSCVYTVVHIHWVFQSLGVCGWSGPMLEDDEIVSCVVEIGRYYVIGSCMLLTI